MYNHSKIEKNIRKFWQENDIYHFDVKAKGKKMYILDMFPYPSGQGLHVGHPKGYTATDAFSRFKKFQGFNVLHPIGWDAFGLPAEQYAIKTNHHPAEFTNKNIDNFRDQLQSLGFCFDYKKEVNTTDEKYYKWTQWIFSRMFEHNLAEIRDIDVNWCDGLKTVLSNEEVLVVDGKMVSERGSFPVVKRKMKQWVLKITQYADRLIDDLSLTDWPESLKSIQTTWIGKSYGLNVNFNVSSNLSLTVYTTRPDTLYGVSFIAIAPENYVVKQLVTKEQEKDVNEYVEKAKTKTLLQRQEAKEKTGVFSGSYAINPVNNKKVPIFIADYVLNDYATGMVMGVPSCDKRDYDFAKKKKLEIIKIIDSKNECEEEDGKHINSEILNGLNIEQAIEKISNELVAKNVAKKIKNYKLKDWIFSRQRYWGEPFPIAFDENNKPHLIKDLPVKIPYMKNIVPSDDGHSPLANLKEWVNVTIDGKNYTRETNTMPQWAGSCWYYIAYLLKQDNGNYLPLDSKEAKEILKEWLPVDLYVGGQEHAVLHLLYARFWHKFLYDIKVVSNEEPFYKLINQGMILGPNGEKMSKSKGNVINPNEIVDAYGADTLRLYEMFMGPLTATLPWSEQGLLGSRKWLDRVYNWYTKQDLKITDNIEEVNKKLIVDFHIFVKDVTEAIESYKFNVAISKMMVYLNSCYQNEVVYLPHHKAFLVVLSVFCPFIAEYLYQQFIKNDSTSIVKNEVWPKFDKAKTIQDKIKLPIQINGKLKEIIEVDNNITQEQAIKLALNQEKIKSFLNGKEPKKVIFVKNKIINIIV